MTPARFVATVAGIGLLRPAPGTWGSAAATAAAWAIVASGGWLALLGAGIVVTLAGVWASGAAAAQSGIHDPGEVVIDEVAGQWLTLAPLACVVAAPLWHWVAGFALFRLFDIIKPWPVSWIDRTIKGGLGVMLDDLAAAVLGAATLALVLRLTG